MLSGSYPRAALTAAPGRWACVCLLSSVLLLLGLARPALAQTTITLSLDPESVVEDAGATTVTVTVTLSSARTVATPMLVNPAAGGTALGRTTSPLASGS